METLVVNVVQVEAKCPVWIAAGLLRSLESVIDTSKYSSIVVVADSRAATTCLQPVVASLAVPGDNVMLLHGAEEIKEVQGLEQLWTFFAERHLDRRSLVVTIGGGSLTDLAGFAAATYMRGISFVNVPTTLLAQVDASIGGKTGINFAGVKNLLGSIMQPAGVVIDVETLTSLPAREFSSGFAEILKHGLIADALYFDRVASRSCTEWSTTELSEIVKRSCEIKKGVVESDPHENGARKTLNFGHTLGHAIEAYARHLPEPLTHGEAISIGMIGEGLISADSGRIPHESVQGIRDAFERAGLLTRLPFEVAPQTLRARISRDKKNSGGTVKWSLLNSIGEATYDVVVPEEMIMRTLQLIQPTL